MRNLFGSRDLLVLAGFIAAFTAVRAFASVPPTPPPMRTLTMWHFDETNLLSNLGYGPRSGFGLQLVSSFASNAVAVSGSSALLNSNEIEPNGPTNILCDNGSVEFWFRPDWASGTNGGSGPGLPGRLIELGAYTGNASYGWWSLYLDAGGTNVYFSSQTNGAGTNCLIAPVQWASNWWHIITLTYCSTSSILFIDGAVAGRGSGVALWPGASVRTNGFALGSDLLGTNLAGGTFENLHTWADPLPESYVTNHQQFLIAHYDPNGVGGGFGMLAGGGFGAFSTGGGAFLPLPGLEGCSGPTISLLTPQYHRATPTNVTIILSNKASARDLFYSTDLISWSYGGRIPAGVLSTNIVNPPPNAFYQLGTMQDADNDGATDAYEMLISHSDPYQNLPVFKVYLTQPQAYSTVP